MVVSRSFKSAHAKSGAYIASGGTVPFLAKAFLTDGWLLKGSWEFYSGPSRWDPPHHSCLAIDRMLALSSVGLVF